jgi:hypothetical protein
LCNGAAAKGQFFCEVAGGLFSGRNKRLSRFHLEPWLSGHEETDESCEAEKKEDNDCPINRAKPGLFRVVGWDERSIKYPALPAHVVSHFSHAPPVEHWPGHRRPVEVE